MTKWEYITTETRGFTASGERLLAKMGRKGWELTSVITFGKPEFIPDVYYTFFFKRPMRGGITPDDIRAAKDCLRRAGVINMPEECPA